MTPRRLILTPLIVLIAGLMVFITIQMGERARGLAPAVAATSGLDAGLRAEYGRIEALRTAVARCTAAEPCVGSAGALRLQAAAASIDGWPIAPSLRAVRQSLQLELRLHAEYVQLAALADADGARSRADVEMLTAALDARYAAARQLVHDRIDAKLDPKAELLARLQRNRLDKDAAVRALRR